MDEKKPIAWKYLDKKELSRETYLKKSSFSIRTRILQFEKTRIEVNFIYFAYFVLFVR